jgi:lysozyme family protein
MAGKDIRSPRADDAIGDAFARAVAIVLCDAIEGGSVDHPRDPGGLTNHSISLRFALSAGDLDRDGRLDLDVDGDGDVDPDDIRAMTPEMATQIYRQHFWQVLRCDLAPQPVALLVFDCGINQGRGPAVGMLQRTLSIPVDGRLGPRTRAAMQGINDVRRTIDEFAALRMHRYATVGDFESFGLGWSRRLMHVHAEAVAWACQGA